MKNKLLLQTIIGILFIGLSLLAAGPTSLGFCLPEIDAVVSGNAEFINIDPQTLQINAADKAIVNYKSFSIGESETVNINLPAASDEILNRVTGSVKSEILGKLFCNGIFLLVNPEGIRFGPNAQIDVAALIASTRDITNSDFLDAKYVFRKGSQEELNTLLLNQGKISVSKGGFGVLIAGAVENQGTILAPVGTIALAGGDLVRLDISSNGMISVAIDQATASTILDQEGKPITDQIKNSGTLRADDGVVLLKAESVTDVFEKAINLEGYISANKVEEKDGLIKIVSTGPVAVNAQVNADQITVGDPAEAVPQEVDLAGGTLTAGAGGITVLAQGNVQSEADLTASGDIKLRADYDADGSGEFKQLAGTIEATGTGNVYIDGSGTMTLGEIKTAEGAIKIGTLKAPEAISGEPDYVHTQGDIKITETQTQDTMVILKTDRADTLRYNSAGKVTLEIGRAHV